jgi:hypothetical protein
VNKLKHCSRCRVDFHPAMFQYHLDHGHVILTCQVCGSPIRRLGIARDRRVKGQFCSEACKRDAGTRGLCLSCSKSPPGTFKEGVCQPCRSRAGLLKREVDGVLDSLRAIRRAEFLPRPYQRRTPHAAS